MGEHISFVVNGTPRELDVEPRRLLVQALREDLDLTGTHVGCDTSQCGACTVHVDGLAVKSCTMLAVQADGSEVRTIEGLASGDDLHPLQAAFWEKHGLQCGFCTPGMIMTAADLLRTERRPVRRRDPPRDRGQLLPLHRVPEHRRRHPQRRRDDADGRRSPRVGLGRGERDDHRRPGRIGQAGRGSALHHRQRQLPRRHQAPVDGPHGHPAQPLRPRQHPLDRHVCAPRPCPACWPSSSAPTSRTTRCRWPGRPAAHRASRTTSTPRGAWPPTASNGPARAWPR